MTLELVSARIMAPIVGSSIFTWTSVIGITLLGLSLGSYLGGIIIDKYKYNIFLASDFILSSIFVFIIPLLEKTARSFIFINLDILWIVIMISLFLFLLPSLLIGLLQPMILKMYADNFSEIGKRYGILSAIWSLGSILGVFMTGFYFIKTIGSFLTLYIIAFILFVLGVFLLIARKKKKLLLTILFLVFALLFINLIDKKQLSPNVVFEKETGYYMARVVDSSAPEIIRPARILFLDFDSHSIEYKEKYEPSFLYTSLYPIFQKINPDIKNIHVIGGGAYTLPKKLSAFYKNSEVSVTEIDEEITDIAKKYFNLNDKQIKTFSEDARVYFKKDKEKYDLIFGDAYNSFISVPWHLMTLEFTELIRNRLNDNGIYAVNFISSLDGKGSEFFQSMLKTFSDVFPNHYIFALGEKYSSVQSIILVGLNNENQKSAAQLKKDMTEDSNTDTFANFLVDQNKIIISKGITLKDDFAPVENLMIPTIKKYFPYYLKLYKAILN
jgi:spermidine synthase